jgi:hypothetical protein
LRPEGEATPIPVQTLEPSTYVGEPHAFGTGRPHSHPGVDHPQDEHIPVTLAFDADLAAVDGRFDAVLDGILDQRLQ